MLYGQYEKLVAELREEDARGYKNYMRISPELFQELLERVGPRLEKGDTFMRKALRPGHRLAIASDQFQTTDQIGICYGYAAVASRHLQLSMVSYGHLRSTTEEMKFLNMLKIAPRKKTKRRKRDG